MKLSERLRTICSFVPEGSAAVDVGCDHAYVPIELVKEGTCPCAVASDIRTGPLQSAAANIAREGLSECIRTVVCDGVPADLPELISSAGGTGLPLTLITAGMGGLMMLQILDNADTDLFSYYVASPQKDARLFRKGLAARRFSIIRETMLEENGKYYPVILAERKNEGIRMLSYDEALLGPCLLKEKSPVFLRYLERRRRILKEILQSVPDSREERRSEARKELEAINRALGN